MLFILSLILSLLFIATIPVYIYLGHKLNESRLRWAIMGFGALFFPSMVCASTLFLFHTSFFFTLTRWPLIQMLSPVFALAIAGYIAYKKGLLRKSSLR
jgi:hypothetical protein